MTEVKKVYDSMEDVLTDVSGLNIVFEKITIKQEHLSTKRPEKNNNLIADTSSIWNRFIIGASSAKKITIDVSDVELGALSRVFPETQVQWCCFHVARAWLSKLEQYVKVGNTLDNDRMMHALKEMMWERRKPEFTVEPSQFIQDPEFVRIAEFMEYFQTTNNYIESWHNQLKTMYLKRKRNKRVDRLVYILVNDIEQDYIHTIQQISNNVGRMSPKERRRRRRELVAHAINEEIIPKMITKRFDDTNNITAVQVKLFSSFDISYEVTVNDGILIACSCQDFIFNKISCKHVRLVKRLYSQFNISHPANSQSLLHQQNNNHIISNYADDSDLFDSFKLIINSLEEKKDLLTEEQSNNIKQHCNDMKNLLSKVNEEQIPANNNLATQRR
ncbi:MAG: hypothetical protein EXX96DRAFT_616579 [Benjaminiella poitrasii]|nr:MAG: hypothetical protein EXX96DRAFT_616579 [Benjaminiella poitrasii]